MSTAHWTNLRRQWLFTLYLLNVTLPSATVQMTIPKWPLTNAQLLTYTNVLGLGCRILWISGLFYMESSVDNNNKQQQQNVSEVLCLNSVKSFLIKENGSWPDVTNEKMLICSVQVGKQIHSQAVIILSIHVAGKILIMCVNLCNYLNGSLCEVSSLGAFISDYQSSETATDFAATSHSFNYDIWCFNVKLSAVRGNMQVNMVKMFLLLICILNYDIIKYVLHFIVFYFVNSLV